MAEVKFYPSKNIAIFNDLRVVMIELKSNTFLI